MRISKKIKLLYILYINIRTVQELIMFGVGRDNTLNQFNWTEKLGGYLIYRISTNASINIDILKQNSQINK